MNNTTHKNNSTLTIPPVLENIETDNYYLILRDKGLCELIYKSTGVITLDVAIEITKKIIDFYPKGYVIIAESEDVMINITTDAREYFAKAPEIIAKRKAQAIISRNLGQRLLVKFYLNFYSHPCPTKAFSNKNDAYIWIVNYLID
jgi:hypothetical protein